MKTLLLFIAVSLALGAAALGIGAMASDEALVQGSVAFALSFVPAAVSLGFVLLSFSSNPETKLLASLASSGFRMAIALGGGYLLTSAYSESFGAAFWYWLVGFYMTLLGFEVALIVRQRPVPPTNSAGAPHQ